MKNSRDYKLYFLFSSLLMLMSPFSYGVTYIFFGYGYENLEIIGLIINSALILISTIIVLLLVYYSKINKPNKENSLFLLFGLLSNFIIYLFVFQYNLKVDEYVDIYSSTIAILVLNLILVNRKKINVELLLISIVLFSFYRFHMTFVHFNYPNEPTINGVSVLLRLLYSVIPFVIVVIYAYMLKLSCPVTKLISLVVYELLLMLSFGNYIVRDSQ